MDYTVKQVAMLSGVTIRTLRFYDKIGLLKPAYVGENSYRYYVKDQLFILQQILLFKEFGFTLKQIKKIIKQSDFDKLQALYMHAHTVQTRIEKLREIAKTLEKTITYLQGKQTMADKEIYYGLDDKKQQDYESYLIKRYGIDIKKHIEESKIALEQWTEHDWQRSGNEFKDICLKLSLLLQKDCNTESEQVQLLIARHYDWIKQFWVPNKESYRALASGYTESMWQERFASFHPHLAEYMVQAMKFFADQKLV